MRNLNRTALIALAAAAATFATCESEKPLPPEADEIVQSCEDVPMGERFASDESFTKFIEAEAAGRVVSEDCRAPVLTAPAPGATLDRMAPPTFTFTPTAPACAQTSATPAVKRSGPPACSPRPRGPWARFLRRSWKMISPIGVAEAHCPAVDGANYLLRISDAEGKAIYTALLSVTSWKPKEENWKRVMSGRGGQSVRVSIQRAMFVRGGIMEGPFVGKQPITLNLAP
jgi:hypothetical protein